MQTLAVVAVLAAALFTAGVTGSSAAVSAQKATFTGYGFDACSAPAVATMQAWTASPYRALGIYIGGANRALRQREPDARPGSRASQALGFSFLPLYVGLQAPCVAQKSLALISPASAQTQGVAAANDAASRATAPRPARRHPDLLRHGGVRDEEHRRAPRPCRRS